LKVVGHVWPYSVVAFPFWSQQLRYGERTARGTAGGTKDTWALTLRDRRRVRSGKKIMVSCDKMKDIALFRVLVTSALDKKNNRGRIGHSQSGKDSCRDPGKG
jgi:hypothetical protein